jgi:hypothetical protein
MATSADKGAIRQVPADEVMMSAPRTALPVA